MKLACKVFLIAVVTTLMDVSVFAQTQQGYVKTKGRMVDGQLVPGQGLKGATVSIKGRAAVLVNSNDGAFSFPVPDRQFRIDSVTKKGYQLVDRDACMRIHEHSQNPFYIVMETPDQQQKDKLNAERKIRRQLQKQLQEKEDAIETLKEKNKITQEEYRQSLQKLYAEQQHNEQLISDMVKRYTTIDYDQMDGFYRQVSYCIENGELTKADSLLRTRGDIRQKVSDLLSRAQIIQSKEEQLAKAEAVHKADQEEAANRCYGFYETFLMRYENDSAAYYLELRASIDTTRLEWQEEAGRFLSNYLADYPKALFYYQRALRQAKKDNNPDWIGISENSIGKVYSQTGESRKALEHLQEASTIFESTYGSKSLALTTLLSNIGKIHDDLGDYDKALG